MVKLESNTHKTFEILADQFNTTTFEIVPVKLAKSMSAQIKDAHLASQARHNGNN